MERNIFGSSGQMPIAGSACLITVLAGVVMLVSRLEEVSLVTMVGDCAHAARNKSDMKRPHFARLNFSRDLVMIKYPRL